MKKSLFAAALICGVFVISAAAQPSAATDDLIERQNTLLEEMAELDSSAPDFQSRLREIGAELHRIQEELQTVDRTGAAAPAGTAPAADRGIGGVSLPEPTSAAPAPFSPFAGMDVATMRRTRADLVTELKHLNRTLETLGPQDAALADSLGEQRLELTARINELDGLIGAPAPETKLPAGAAPASAAEPTAADPAAGGSGAPVLNPAEIDRIDALFEETQTPAADPTDVDGAWYSGDNKNQKILDAIAELQKSNDEVNRRLDEVMDELKTIETQLKLLSRQAVIEK